MTFPQELIEGVLWFIERARAFAGWFNAQGISKPVHFLIWLTERVMDGVRYVAQLVLIRLPDHNPIPLPPVSVIPKALGSLLIFDRVLPLVLLFIIFANLLVIQGFLWAYRSYRLIAKLLLVK